MRLHHHACALFLLLSLLPVFPGSGALARRGPGPLQGWFAYAEDFSSYIHKETVDRSEWDVFDHKLALSPMSSGAHRESYIAPDGQGGAYIAWSDLRNNLSNGDWDVYAQHVDGRGNRLWAADLRVNSDTTVDNQSAPVAFADGQGNALVAWIDDRDEYNGVYAQKISPDGTRLWPADLRITSVHSPRLCWGEGAVAAAQNADGTLVVVWQALWEGQWDTPNVYAQRIDADGQRLWGDDVRVNAIEGHVDRFTAVGVDGAGFATVAWMDRRDGGEDIYAQRLDPAGNRIWVTDRKISAGTGVSPQGNPQVVVDSQGDAVVVWRIGSENPPAGQLPSTIYAQKVDPGGAMLWSEGVRVNQDTTLVYRGWPQATLVGSDDVLVMWDALRPDFHYGDVLAQRLGPDGTPRWPTDLPLSPDGWWDQRTGHTIAVGNIAWIGWSVLDNVYLQFLDVATTRLLLPTPARVNDANGKANQWHADVSIVDGERSLVAWFDYCSGPATIRALSIDPDGQPLWPGSFQVNDRGSSTDQRRPRIATNTNGRSLVVWHDLAGVIYGQMLDTAGNRLWVTDRRIDGHGGKSYYPSAAALPDGSFVVAWVSEREAGSPLWDVRLQRLDEEGERFWADDLRINSADYGLGEVDARSRPDLAIDAQGHIVLVWRGEVGPTVDIYARRFAPDGTPDWSDDVALASGISTRSWYGGEVMCAAAASGEITVAWAAHREGLYGIYAQRLDLVGQPLWGPGVWVSSTAREVYYGNPDLALAQGEDVVVIWDDERYGRNVYAQRLGPAGGDVWPDELMLNGPGAWPLHPSLSAEAGGGFIAVWHDERYDDDSVYARRFGADGSLLWDQDVGLIADESFYYPAGSAESNAVDDTPDDIIQAGLIVSQTLSGGGVAYSLSNDGGQTWEAAIPGRLHAFDSTGSDLRWQVTLVANSDGRRSPTVGQIILRYGPDVVGDAFEPDGACAQSQPIWIGGSVQEHAFHQEADVDWVTFDATAGTVYLIEAEVPLDSPADMVAELYDQCGGLPLVSQDYAFAPGIRLEYQATADGPLYLKLFDNDPEVHGPAVIYHLTVRALAAQVNPGAVVIVAGRLYLFDPLQANIHHVSNQVHHLFLEHDYPEERIYYLATNLGLPGADAWATADNLEAALTQWAPALVGPDRAFTLYMVDHGGYDKFYLDQPFGQWVSPQQVDEWLTHLETLAPGVKVNVIVESCKSGSFIDLVHTISRPGRVIITSTDSQNPAYASPTGAVFSDYFLTGLAQAASLNGSFELARQAAHQAHPAQNAWLDDDGDGQANEPEDGQEAAHRGFAYLGTLPPKWAPWLVQATVSISSGQGSGVVRAEVVDDQAVEWVWAVVYPPSYRPPPPGDELVSETLPTLVLLPQGEGWYAASYPGFDETGLYRVVVYARDEDGLQAKPQSVEVRTGWSVFLPAVRRDHQ